MGLPFCRRCPLLATMPVPFGRTLEKRSHIPKMTVK